MRVLAGGIVGYRMSLLFCPALVSCVMVCECAPFVMFCAFVLFYMLSKCLHECTLELNAKERMGSDEKQ